MKWEEIKKRHPSRWVVIEAIEAHDRGNLRIIDDSSVINVFEHSMDAYRKYCKLHRNNPSREFLFVSTDMPTLEIPCHRWVGLRG